MMEQPDKFFREKLSTYRQSAPSGAWNRVAQNLRKSRRVLWLRIAASVLVVITSGIALYPVLKPDAAGSVTETRRSAPAQQPLALTPKSAQKEADTTKKADTIARIATAPQSESPPLSRHGKQTQATARKADLAANKTRQGFAAEKTEGATPRAENIALNAHAANAVNGQTGVKSALMKDEDRSRPLMIVFSAEEVNEKYLTKSTKEEATRKEKESSGLKKLLDKARDLKTNQDLLGDLRQKKNEILAMNFRNGKQTTEND